MWPASTPLFGRPVREIEATVHHDDRGIGQMFRQRPGVDESSKRHRPTIPLALVDTGNMHDEVNLVTGFLDLTARRDLRASPLGDCPRLSTHS